MEILPAGAALLGPRKYLSARSGFPDNARKKTSSLGCDPPRRYRVFVEMFIVFPIEALRTKACFRRKLSVKSMYSMACDFK